MIYLEESHIYDIIHYEETHIYIVAYADWMVIDMYFKRKAYDKLINWKQNYADDYAVLLEGARRVGKSTIAEQFARNEY